MNFSKLLNVFALPFLIYKLGIIALPHRLVMRIKRVNFGNYLSSAGQILITKLIFMKERKKQRPS